MAERGLQNETPFAAQELFLSDENGWDLLVVVVKATYTIRAGADLVLAERQVPVDLAGTYHGDPETTSMRFEPEVAPVKLATDVVLVGHAYANQVGARHVDVGFQVGPIRKVIRVFGDRYWYSRMGFCRMSDPAPFERIPLIYERAFGGWDRTAENPDKHRVDMRNPVGVGYRKDWMADVIDEAPLPNLEDPRHLITNFTDKPPPAGFGFIKSGWMPRVQYAGTYDEAWQQTRMPLLPRDFDRRYYNAAPQDQRVVEYLNGDEPVVIANASPGPWLQFSLPGEPSPRLVVSVHGQPDEEPPVQLDTLILDTDTLQVYLIWRAHTVLRSGVHSIDAMRVVPHEDSAHAEPESFAVYVP